MIDSRHGNNIHNHQQHTDIPVSSQNGFEASAAAETSLTVEPKFSIMERKELRSTKTLRSSPVVSTRSYFSHGAEQHLLQSDHCAQLCSNQSHWAQRAHSRRSAAPGPLQSPPSFQVSHGDASEEQRSRGAEPEGRPGVVTPDRVNLSWPGMSPAGLLSPGSYWLNMEAFHSNSTSSKWEVKGPGTSVPRAPG